MIGSVYQAERCSLGQKNKPSVADQSLTEIHSMQGEAPMLVPDILVCSVGTEIFFESSGEADAEWSQELDKGWDRSGALQAASAITALCPQVHLQFCF